MIISNINSQKLLITISLLTVTKLSMAQRIFPFAYNNGTKVNYVRTWDAKAPQTDENKIRITSSIDSFIMTTQYIDGLGRPIQTVVKNITPLGKDLVSPIVYDEIGREQYKYLPFAANNAGGNASLSDGLFKLNPFQQDSTFSKAQYPGENYFYSQVFFEKSPLSRSLESFAPGDNWAGTSGQLNSNNRRSIKMEYLINTVSDSVRIWSVTGNVSAVPTTSTRYAQGELYKTVTIDEHLEKVIEYKDKDGKVILKKVQLASSPGNAHVGWLCTYYIYDDLGNLRFVLQPRAVEFLLASASWTISNTIRDELCFYYGYDERNRMIVKKVPGAGEVYMVYDKRDRLVMTQDSLLRVAQKWMVILYDDLNRVVQTGLVNNSSIGTKSFASHRADAYSSVSYPFDQWNIPGAGYEMLSQTGYDQYDSIPIGGPNGTLATTHINSTNFFTSYNTAPEYAQALSKTNQTRGMAIWTKTKVLGTTSDYLFSTTIYDEKARVIQVKSTNISGGVDTLTSQYDFSGKLLRSFVAHSKAGANTQRYYVLTKNNYDVGGRMISVSKRTNRNNSANTTDKVIAEMSYNELGQLKEKKLAPAYSSNTGLESLAFDYNIRGWMLGANRDYAKTAASTSHYFGFDLGYDKTSIAPAGGSGLGNYVNAQYNGNIGGMTWKSTGDDEIRKYDFTYDAVNRLTGADFNQYTSSSFNKTAGIDFTVKNLTYDANGNILTMDQRGWKVTGSTTIDSMQYHYYSYSNKLMNVIDRANDINTRLGDFRASQLYMTALSNNKTSGATDYTYDANGNMVKDKNKDIEAYSGANGIEYNHLNLPKKITVKSTSANKGTIEYIYDATGNKQKKVTTEGAKITTTLYLYGNYVNDTLQFLPQEEGRIRFRVDSNDFVYDYFIKDHLGNVRMVLTEEKKVDMYPAATMEENELTDEELIYARLETRTNIIPEDYPKDSYTDPNEYVAKLLAEDRKIGPAITLKVMAGDKINIRASSWYMIDPNNPNSTYESIINDLIEVFAGQAGNMGKVSAGEIINNDQFFSNVESFLYENESSYTSGKPNASVNWILFDEQFKLVSSGSGFDEVGDDKEFKVHLLNGIEVPKNGYLFVFVSNSDLNVPVYFDNLQVTHVRGPVLEETHYYPFGLVQLVISSKAMAFDGAENKIKYNSFEHNNDFDLNYYESFYRTHDPQLGRFWQVDPKPNESVSLYATMDNNPLKYSDPLGDTIIFTQAFLESQYGQDIVNLYKTSETFKKLLSVYDIGGESGFFGGEAGIYSNNTNIVFDVYNDTDKEGNSASGGGYTTMQVQNEKGEWVDVYNANEGGLTKDSKTQINILLNPDSKQSKGLQKAANIVTHELTVHGAGFMNMSDILHNMSPSEFVYFRNAGNRVLFGNSNNILTNGYYNSSVQHAIVGMGLNGYYNSIRSELNATLKQKGQSALPNDARSYRGEIDRVKAAFSNINQVTQLGIYGQK